MLLGTLIPHAIVVFVFFYAQVRMSMSCSSTMRYHGLGFLFCFGLLQSLQCPFVVHHCVIAMQISMTQ
jgi:hypothetical protein